MWRSGHPSLGLYRRHTPQEASPHCRVSRIEAARLRVHPLQVCVVGISDSHAGLLLALRAVRHSSHALRCHPGHDGTGIYCIIIPSNLIDRGCRCPRASLQICSRQRSLGKPLGMCNSLDASVPSHNSIASVFTPCRCHDHHNRCYKHQ